MESEVVRRANTADCHGDEKCKDAGLATASPTLEKQQNCHNETSVASMDSISMVEADIKTIHNSNASSKLHEEELITHSSCDEVSATTMGPKIETIDKSGASLKLYEEHKITNCTTMECKAEITDKKSDASFKSYGEHTTTNSHRGEVSTMLACKVDTINKSGASSKLCKKHKIEDSTSDEVSAKMERKAEHNELGRDPGFTDGLYFFEDIVFSFDLKGRVYFGLVMETAGDEEFDEDLEKGDVRVFWCSKGYEKVHPENTALIARWAALKHKIISESIAI